LRKLSEYCTKEFTDILQTYISVCSNERTFYEYCGYINLICNYTKKDFLRITYEDAKKYQDYLISQYNDGKLSRKTANVRFSCYRTVSNYIIDTFPDKLKENVFLKIPRLMQPDDSINPKSIPSLKELDKIMSSARSNYMFYLILSLATRVGLSATNILRIRKNSIIVDEEGNTFLHFAATSDFKDDRYVQLPKDVSSILEKYLETVEADSQGHIFFNSRKGPLTLKNLDVAVSKIIKAAKVDEKYTLKDLRSRAILDLLQTGADANAISDYTGLSFLRIHSFTKAKKLVSGDCIADAVNFSMKS
jgi:site-specific recombinase XerD